MERYEKLLEAANSFGGLALFGTAVFELTDSVELIQANECFYDLFGTTPSDYKDGVFSRFSDADRKKYEQFIKERVKSNNGYISFDFRIAKKNSDDLLWVKVEARKIERLDDIPVYFAVLYDVSKTKRLENENDELKNLYLKAISSSDEIIFDYKVKEDVFIYYKLVEDNGNVINKPTVRPRFLEDLPTSKDVYSDDLVYFYDLCRDGINHPFDVRFRRTKQKPGEYTKMRVHATVQKDDKGKPVNIIGTIRPLETINDVKNSKKEASLNDELTGVKNRNAFKLEVESFLLNSSVASPYALLILDIKDFKQVNDNFGHMFGDNVLIQVADSIIENINRNDVVGRLGGDEFIIFLKNVSENAVYAISEKIRRSIRGIYVGEESYIDACIGAVVSKDPSNTYDALLHTADGALFDVITSDERVGIKVSKEIVNAYKDLKISYIADRNIISTPNAKEKRLSELIFELLEQARDIDKALDTVLALVGDKKKLSRITIMRRDGRELTVTKQWVSRGMRANYNVDGEAFIGYQDGMKDNFAEENMGIINKESANKFSPDAASKFLSEGAKSIMYCNMFELGEIVGVIAFVDCVNEREWTEIDYKAYRTIARMISAYTIKASALKKIDGAE